MLLLGCLAVPAQMISQALLTHCAVRIFPQTALRPFKSRSKHIYSLLCVQRGFTNKRSCRTCLLDVIVRSEQSILLNMTQRRERQTEEGSEGVAATGIRGASIPLSDSRNKRRRPRPMCHLPFMDPTTTVYYIAGCKIKGVLGDSLQGARFARGKG